MGCELEIRPRETKTEPIRPPRLKKTGIDTGTNNCCESEDIEHVNKKRTTATNKSENNFQQSDRNMASKGFTLDPTTADDKPVVFLNSADGSVNMTEVQPPSSLGDESVSASSRENPQNAALVQTKSFGNELSGKNETSVNSGSNIRDEQNASNDSHSDVNVKADVLKNLEMLKNRLDSCTDIPELLYDVTLNCLKPSTIDYLSFHLDPESEVLTSDGRCKDYRGLAEEIGLEPIFIKYISRSSHLMKTREVLSKWLTLENEPLPNLKNIRECLLRIERPDVLEDMSVKMARDAVSWKMTEYEAQTKRHAPAVNTSWQLTRHDVVSGKKTMYTACLLYADEDELMAQLIIKLYKTAYKDALFFLPQFDLKHGKYILDTTAKVIDERCDKKVVFLLSEYFYASQICQFAVNYAAAHGTGHGNLIPFHLTRNVEAVPNVLKGIAGIRWFRKGTREHTWNVLTDSLLGEKMEDKALLRDIKDGITKLVEKDKEYYLQDPPYDKDVGPPGEPIKLSEPEGSSSMPSSLDCEIQNIKLEEERQERKPKFAFLKQLKKAITEKMFQGLLSKRNSKGPHTSSKYPKGTTMKTWKVIETPAEDISSKSSSGKQAEKETKEDESELGAVGGTDDGRLLCNDLVDDTANISESNSTSRLIESNKTKTVFLHTQQSQGKAKTNCACLYDRQSSQRLGNNIPNTRNHNCLVCETYSDEEQTLQDDDMDDDTKSEAQTLLDNHKESQISKSNVAQQDGGKETAEPLLRE